MPTSVLQIENHARIYTPEHGFFMPEFTGMMNGLRVNLVVEASSGIH
jgi:hypothetical protein